MSSTDTPHIELDRFSVRFPGRPSFALWKITAQIRPGDVIAITGPSGSGKTTLLRALAGFIPGTFHAHVEGEIRVDGRTRTLSDPAVLSPTIGLVQQDPDAQICTLRVRSEAAFGPENLCLPRDEIDTRVRVSLDSMGIAPLAHRETTTLSGGEKQRLAAASILAMRPSVILLDEPTAHLDPAGAKALFDLLAEVRARHACTLLVVEHRLPPLDTFNPQLWVLDGGRLVDRRPTRTRPHVRRLVPSAGADAPPGSTSRRHGRGLTIRHLSFGYRSPLIRDLSLSLHPGTVLGVIGPNGGGKTTLIRLIAGLERPDGGEIQRPEGLRIGMVFQHPHQQIFERTVRRDLEIEGPLPEDALRTHLSEARLAGLSEVAPHALSLGEQRRLTVLSAFRTDPDLLLLDEPFIGQDRENVMWIARQITEARSRGAIVCLVTHDIDVAGALCDRVLYLGERTLEGVPHDVFEQLRATGDTAFTPGFWEIG